MKKNIRYGQSFNRFAQSAKLTVSAELCAQVQQLPEPRAFTDGVCRPAVELPDSILMFARTAQMPPRHRPACAERYTLIISLKGSGDVIVDNLAIRLRPSQALMIFPRQMHHYARLQSGPFLWLYISFQLSMPEPFSPLSQTVVTLPKSARYPINRIIEAYSGANASRTNATALSLHLRLLLDLLLASQVPDTLSDGDIGLLTSPITLSRLRAIQVYVLEHLVQPIRVAAMATAVHVSVSTFNRWFRKTTGKTLGLYVRLTRLHHACGLMETTDLTMADIAERCGYQSVYAFSRAFSRILHEPPAAYRRRRRAITKPTTKSWTWGPKSS